MIQPAGRQWDVIVVGGGPAGSVTSGLLAQRGLQVLLLDRAVFPRSKPCGESVNPGAVRELRELGLLDLVQALPHRPISGWTIRPAKGPAFRGAFPPDHPGIAIDRALFDSALVSWATGRGAILREGQQVVDLIRDGAAVGGVVTRDGREHRTGIVIGCDGLRSVVMRRAGLLGRPPVLRKAALTAHVRGSRLSAGRGELHFLPWGTAGIVEISDDLANVVLVMEHPERLRGETVASLFDRLMAEAGPLRGAVRVGEVRSTGPFDVPTRAVSTPGAMLVGDAAGYFDPFTGQGIYRALRGARMAAGAAWDALDRPDHAYDAMHAYAHAHRTAFSPGVALQKVIEEATSHPAVLSFLASGLAWAPAAADFIVRRTGDIRLGASGRIPRVGATV